MLARWAKPHPSLNINKKWVSGSTCTLLPHTQRKIPSVCGAKNPLCAFLNEFPVISGRLLMTMEAGADTQQSGDTAVSESEAQQISLAQVKTKAPASQKQNSITCLCMSHTKDARQPYRDLAWLLGLQASIAAAQVSSSSPTVTLVQLPNGQTVQVHGVIQAAQPSVIQSPQVQTVQVKQTIFILCSGAKSKCFYVPKIEGFCCWWRYRLLVRARTLRSLWTV